VIAPAARLSGSQVLIADEDLITLSLVSFNSLANILIALEALGKTMQDTSEFGIAASVSEAIMSLVPGLSCDT
jgi:hypothetical protein